MKDVVKCPICKKNATKTTLNPYNGDSKINCPFCGSFPVSEDFLEFPESLSPEKVLKVREWFKNNPEVILREKDWSKFRRF